MAESTATNFRRRRDVRFRIIDGEAVVLRQEAGETLVLNEVGSRILQLFDGGAQLPEVVHSISTEFEVEAAEAEADTLFFAGQLVEAGILEATHEATPPHGTGQGARS